MWKRFVNDYLSYTHKERTGIFVVLGFIALFIFIPFLFPYFIHQKHYDHTKFDNEIAQLKIQQKDSLSAKNYYNKNFDDDNVNVYTGPSEKNYPSKEPTEVFNFDPNTATSADWKRLGIKNKTIETIQKYLSKGGRFYKPEDITKIWA
jgi:DNA uptake protein ComE-like DNA-binding protein